MKNQHYLPLKLCAALLLLSAGLSLPVSCSLPAMPDGKGTVSITLPGGMSGSARTAFNEKQKEQFDGLTKEMSYELSFTGPGKTQTKNADAEESIIVFLEPGTWKVDVKALYPEFFEDPSFPMGGVKWLTAGTGSKVINVRAGQVNREIITMELADDFLNPVGSGSQMFWATALFKDQKDAFYIDAEDCLMPPRIETEFKEYQWYSKTRTLGGWEEIPDANEQCLDMSKYIIIYPDPLGTSGLYTGQLTEETMHFYCDVTYTYGTGIDKKPYSGKTDIFSVYPPTSQGLQKYIEDSNEENPYINLPPGLNSQNPNEIVMNSTVEVNKDITIYPNFGSGTTLTRYDNQQEPFQKEMFIVNSGTLTLVGWDQSSSLVLDGVLYSFNGISNGSLIKIESGGVLEMYEYVTLENNDYNGNGGGVYINEGFFNMSGGKISNNTSTNGGGVYNSGGTFNMSAGEISGNSSPQGNGGGVYNSGIFNMSGGEIKSNTRAICGGGVYIDEGREFSKSAGIIYGNDNTIDGNEAATNSAGHAVYFKIADFFWYRDKTLEDGDLLNTDDREGWDI